MDYNRDLRHIGKTGKSSHLGFPQTDKNYPKLSDDHENTGIEQIIKPLSGKITVLLKLSGNERRRRSLGRKHSIPKNKVFGDTIIIQITYN